MHLHLHVPVHALQSMLTVDNKDTYIIIIDLYMEWIIAIRIVRHIYKEYKSISNKINKENKNIPQNMYMLSWYNVHVILVNIELIIVIHCFSLNVAK